MWHEVYSGDVRGKSAEGSDWLLRFAVAFREAMNRTGSLATQIPFSPSR